MFWSDAIPVNRRRIHTLVLTVLSQLDATDANAGHEEVSNLKINNYAKLNNRSLRNTDDIVYECTVCSGRPFMATLILTSKEKKLRILKRGI